MQRLFEFARKGITRFHNITMKQQQKGFEKYSKELDPHDPQHDWLNMAEEELADAWQYIQCERARRDKVHDMINGFVIKNQLLESDVNTLVRNRDELHVAALDHCRRADSVEEELAEVIKQRDLIRNQRDTVRAERNQLRLHNEYQEKVINRLRISIGATVAYVEDLVKKGEDDDERT